MKYQFVRMQDDGRISSITPIKTFPSVEIAKLAAPDLLVSRKGGGRIVLIEIQEVAICTSNVRYEKWDAATQKKHGDFR